MFRVKRMESSMIIGQFFFFFQAEDGIRDHCVTGVQTCALPIFGNIIWNPPGSGVRLSILKWTSNVVATSASLTGIGIAGGFQTTSPTGLGAATAKIGRASCRERV